MEEREDQDEGKEGEVERRREEGGGVAIRYVRILYL